MHILCKDVDCPTWRADKVGHFRNPPSLSFLLRTLSSLLKGEDAMEEAWTVGISPKLCPIEELGCRKSFWGDTAE